MKKVLTILVVLALVAGFAFATDSTPAIPAIGNHGTVTLSTTVTEIVPVFNIYHSDTDAVDKGVSNIAAGNIEASFVVKQENTLKYSNYGIAAGKGVTLKVTCGPFKNADVESTAAVTVDTAAYAAVSSANTDKLGLTGDPDTSANTATFVPTYKGKRVDDQPIGTFTATWTKDDSLPLGDYTADITLTYIAD